MKPTRKAIDSAWDKINAIADGDPSKILRAIELLRRGFKCGLFDDAPVFKADVRKVLEG